MCACGCEGDIHTRDTLTRERYLAYMQHTTTMATAAMYAYRTINNANIDTCHELKTCLIYVFICCMLYVHP